MEETKKIDYIYVNKMYRYMKKRYANRNIYG